MAAFSAVRCALFTSSASMRMLTLSVATSANGVGGSRSAREIVNVLSETWLL